MCFLGSIAFMQSQNTFTSDQVTGEASVTVESLLERVEQIGTVSGNVRDHFTSRELRMLNVHFNGVQNLAPRVITQSNSQVITAGDDIACASPTSFRDNNMFRVFDLAGVFGVLDGFEVNAVEFAIGTITTPSGFPITANIYSVTPGSFPGSYPAGLTLQGTAVYTATNADMASMITLPLTATIPAGEAMVMELVLEDDGSDTNFMRFGCNSNGETGPSYIMAADCGATSPTKFSDLSLTLGDDEIAAPGPTLIFGINNATENLISFSIDDPDGFTVVGPSSAIDFENAGAIDPNNTGDAYVLDNAGRFFKVDLASGVYTSLGTIAAPGGQTWAGAEFDPVSGNLYAISTNVSQSTLSMIDIATLLEMMALFICQLLI